MVMKEDGTYLEGTAVGEDRETRASPKNEHLEHPAAIVNTALTTSSPRVTNASVKRLRSPSSEVLPEQKRGRRDESSDEHPCKAPPECNRLLEAESSIKKNVLLAENWREKWCHCPRVGGLAH